MNEKNEKHVGGSLSNGPFLPPVHRGPKIEFSRKDVGIFPVLASAPTTLKKKKNKEKQFSKEMKEKKEKQKNEVQKT